MLIKYKTELREYHTEIDENIGNYKVNEEGYLHSLDGAAIFYKWNVSDLNENNITSQYYINGWKYTKSDWEIEMNRIKMLEEL